MTQQTDVDLIRANKLRADRLAKTVRSELDVLYRWLLATALVLPLSLLWADGVLQWVGLAYACGYALAMLAPSGVHVILGYDAIRLIFNKRPLLAPYVLGLGLAAMKEGVRLPLPWHRKALLYGNPLFSVVSSLSDLATSRNPRGVIDMMERAESVSQMILDGRFSRASIVAAAEQEAEAWRERTPRRRSTEPAYC